MRRGSVPRDFSPSKPAIPDMLLRSFVPAALTALGAALLSSTVLAAEGEPSRAPLEGCAWEQISDAGTGMTAWVQSCDFGDGRTLGYAFDGNRLVQKSSDFEELVPVAEVFDIKAGETATDALKRVYAELTEPGIAKRCVLKQETETELPAGIARYSFVADAELQKELDATTVEGDIPETRCGPYGMTYESVRHFQTIEGADKLVFLDLGQDDPLFDDMTLSFK